MENSNIEVIEYNVQEIEAYQDLINDIKIRMTVDAGLLDDEIKSLLKECKQEILTLKQNISDLQQDNLETFEACRIMSLQIHTNYRLMEIKDDVKREKLKKLLLTTDADMLYMDVDKVDNMFDVILGEKASNE